MKSSSKLPILLAVLGIGYFLWDAVVPQLVEDFANNIGVTFRQVRIKWAGWAKPTTFNFYFDLDVRNSNPVGGQVKGFMGRLLLGKKNGYDLGNLAIAPFPLKANETAQVELLLQLDLISFGTQIIDLIKKEDYFRQLWVIGRLDTSFGPVDIEQEVKILYG